jgi:CubicO group peptidase (beta-lactamase class C family)
LLTHSSGVYNYTNDFDEEDSAIVNHPVPRQMVLDRFYNKPLEFEPGNQFSYNNSGYFLAGLVIEKATGKPYEQNVREIIFEPLNMTRSGFHYNGLPAGSRATGYQFLNAAVQKQYTLYDSTVGYAAGSIYSTSANLLKWAQAIMERKILGQASWDAALTSRFNGYGYGFQTGDFEGKNYIRLTGGYPGFVSEMMLYPKDSVSLILLKNVADYGQDLFALALEVSNIAFEKPYDLWQTRTPVILPEAVLKEYEGRYKLNNKSVAGEIYSAFVLKESHLYMVTPSGTEFLLTPAGNDTFFNENYNSLIRFSRDKKGAVVKLTSRERGTNAEWNRIK